MIFGRFVKNLMKIMSLMERLKEMVAIVHVDADFSINSPEKLALIGEYVLIRPHIALAY